MTPDADACANQPTATSSGITVTVLTDPPDPPLSIGGPTTLCKNLSDYPEYTYSVTPVAGATSYTWSYPSVWTVIGPDDENSITFDVSSSLLGATGTVSVTANNVCGSSTETTTGTILVANCWIVIYNSEEVVTRSVLDSYSDVGSNCYTVGDPTSLFTVPTPFTPPPGQVFVGWYDAINDIMYTPGDQICTFVDDIVLDAIFGPAGCAGQLIGAIYVDNQPTCTGNAGSIIVDIIGTSGNYTYAVNGVDYGIFTSPYIIENLPVGNYTVTVYDVDNDCEDISPTLGLVGQGALTVPLEITPADAPTCSDDGTVSGTVVGAVGYTYRIDGITIAYTYISAIQSNTTFSLPSTEPLPVGEYELTIIDADGCKAPAGKFTIGATVFSANNYTIDVIPGDCTPTDNIIKITVDGAGEYFYNLNGTGWILIADNDIEISVVAGLHTIRLMDDGGCISELETKDVTQTNNNVFTVTAMGSTPTSCGESNGTITGTITPLGDYNYYLFAGHAGLLSIESDGSFVIEDVPAGIYHLVINNEGHEPDITDCAYFHTLYNTEVPQGVILGSVAAPSAVTPQRFCQGAIVANLQATGTNIRWYASDGTLLPDTHPLDSGHIYYAVQMIDGVCIRERTAVSVIISDIIINVPNLPIEVELCHPATLEDVPTNGNTNIVWFNQMVGGIELPLSTSLIHGGRYYAAIKYGIGAGACFSIQRREVNIVFVEEVSKPDSIYTPQHFCFGALIANIETPNNKIVWYFNENDIDPLPNTTKLITHTYYAAQQAGNCESTSRIPVQIFVDEYPAPFAPSKQTICKGKIKFVSDLMVIGAGIKWFDVPNDGTAIANPESRVLMDGEIYYAAQTAGTCEGPRTPVEITDECYSCFGTVFPFVNTEDKDFDKQFIVTAKLYVAPPANIVDKIGYTRKQIPICEEYVTYYNCNTDEPIVGAPKHPGVPGRTNNPGLPIRWSVFGYSPLPQDPNTLSDIDRCPTAPIGKYIFKDVPPNNYIIELYRPGFLIRYGEITITSTSADYLGHRELLAGDVNGDFMISDKDLSVIRSKTATYGQLSYNWMYDLNGSKTVDTGDTDLIRINLGASMTIYRETYDWTF
jgi:hypothetical protein